MVLFIEGGACMDINERVAKVEVEIDNHEKRLDSLEKMTTAVTELAVNMKTLTQDMGEVKDDVKETKDKVNDLENRPYKASGKVWVWLLGLMGSALFGALVTTLSSALG